VSSVELETLTDEEASVSSSLLLSFGGRKRQKTFITKRKLMIDENIQNSLPQDNHHHSQVNLSNQNVFSSSAFVKPFSNKRQKQS
jgi:hypothetical protein